MSQESRGIADFPEIDNLQANLMDKEENNEIPTEKVRFNRAIIGPELDKILSSRVLSDDDRGL